MPTAVRSHAKVNLGLHIGAPRADGFHPLATVYQTLELYDVVTVSARKAAVTRIELTSNDKRVPTDNRNTAWKMVTLALGELGLTAEIEIHIDKRLPVQGGLGAGSANAVAALVGLEAELGIASQQVSESASQPGAPPFSRSLRKGWDAKSLEIAARVGSDVPLFLIGGTVLGQDRGQVVSALPDLEPTWCVIAMPAIGVSTPLAFRDWDELCAAEGLTAEASQDRLKELSRAYASAFSGSSLGSVPGGRPGAGSSGVLAAELDGEDLAGPLESALVRTGISSWIENDFERVVFPQHPSLAEIKRILLGSPGTPEAACHSSSLMASLSGSGSALFGLYRTREDAEMAQVRLKEQLRETEVRSTLTRTLPRKAYWSEMILK
jgi:4-diphosphocytidyl-2-C-methyl-D-erythritol kinase